jgi:hypothetical protein
MQTPVIEADFTTANLGSLIAITPLSARANAMVDNGDIAFESWQMMGGSIMVDHRYGLDLIESLIDDGYQIVPE